MVKMHYFLRLPPQKIDESVKDIIKPARIPMQSPKNDEARRFLRELFMYRYSQLLLEVMKHYPDMSEAQKTKLYKTILNLEWIDTCFDPV